MNNNQEDVDFILNEVMNGKPIEPIEIEFILEDFTEGKNFIIGDSYVFEILKVSDGTVLLKPIGINMLEKQTWNTDAQTLTHRFIEDGKIIERTEK